MTALLFAALFADIAAADEAARRNYILRCAGCHGIGGEGTIPGAVPAFPGSIGAIADQDMGRTYMLHVPGVRAARMDTTAIAEVMNYILDQWSDGRAPSFTKEEVRQRLSEDVTDIVAYRRELAASLATVGIKIAPYPWP